MRVVFHYLFVGLFFGVVCWRICVVFVWLAGVFVAEGFPCILVVVWFGSLCWCCLVVAVLVHAGTLCVLGGS